MEMKLLSMLSVLSVLGSLGLYGYAVIVRPEMVLTSGNAADCSGKYIVTNGMVREVLRGWDGELSVEVLPADGAPSVWLLIESETLMSSPRVKDLLTGAQVRAEGVASIYKGHIEIHVNGPDDIEVQRQSSLAVIESSGALLKNTGVCFTGMAFYKKLSSGRLSFQLVDRLEPLLAVNCTSSSYFPGDERIPWENGTMVRVTGRLASDAYGKLSRLVIIGGARGVEVV